MGRLCALIAALVVVLSSAATASACSLAYQPPRERVDRASAAIFAEVVDARQVARDERGFATWRYSLRVVETFKGSVGDVVEVEGSDDDAACGLGRLQVGERYGLLLRGSSDPWHAGLADLISHDDLVSAIARYPAASGEGVAALLVGGPFGSADVLALDANGRVLAYGFGTGAPQSVCPGSERFVARRAVVRMSDLASVARRPSPGWTSARCLDRLGRRVAGFTSASASGGRSRLVLSIGARRRMVDAGGASEAVLGRRSALLLTRGRVARVSYATGRRRFVARLPRSSRALAVSPDGRRLAVLAGDRVVVADQRTGRGLVRSVGAQEQVVWLSADRLLVGGRIFSASLRLVGAVPGGSARAVARGGDVLWRLGGDGRLLASLRSGGETRPLFKLPAETRGPLLAIPGGAEITASQRTPA